MADQTEEVVDRGDKFVSSDAAATELVKPVEEVVDKVSAEAVHTEPEPDEVAAKTDTDEAGRDEKGRFIPKARFDEAVTKERERAQAAEREVAALQKQMESVSRTAGVAELEAKLLALRKEDRKAVMDGDEDRSLELAAQIDRINRQIVINESQNMSAQAQEGAREDIRVDMAIEKLETAYSMLKEGSEDYDQGLVDLVLAAQTQLMTRDRMSPSQALVKAASEIMLRFRPAVHVDDKPASGLGGAKGADRAAAAKAKNIDAALRQPPSFRDVGIDSDKAGARTADDAQPETVDDLKAIPLATLKRMRGDILA